MQKLYPGDITGERVVPCMRSAGVMVDMAYFIGADQEYLGHAMLPLQDVKRTVEPLRDTLQNWLASLTRADERNPGNARNELAIIGIRAFAREMDITLPNMAVGVEREV